MVDPLCDCSCWDGSSAAREDLWDVMLSGRKEEGRLREASSRAMSAPEANEPTTRTFYGLESVERRDREGEGTYFAEEVFWLAVPPRMHDLACEFATATAISRRGIIRGGGYVLESRNLRYTSLLVMSIRNTDEIKLLPHLRAISETLHDPFFGL